MVRARRERAGSGVEAGRGEGGGGYRTIQGGTERARGGEERARGGEERARGREERARGEMMIQVISSGRYRAAGMEQLPVKSQCYFIHIVLHVS